jgi:hypothetical protein
MSCNTYKYSLEGGSVQKTQRVSSNEFSGNFVIKYQTSLLVFSLSLYFITFLASS